MTTKKKKQRNRQRSTRKGKTMTACNTLPDASRDGLGINNRATIAPNNSTAMTENFIKQTATSVPVDSTTTPREIKSVVQQCDGDSHCTKADGLIEDVAHDETKPAPKVATAPATVDTATFRFISDPFGKKDKQVKILPCRKPNRQEYVRARSGDWSIDTILVQNEINGDYYLVHPALHEHVADDCIYARLTMAMTWTGELFLWLQKLPSPNGRSNRWNDSMLTAVKHAKTVWVRVVSNLHAQCYEFYEAPRITAEPHWTDMELSEILSISFKDRIIDTPDHQFLKRLKGEA